MQNKVNVVTTAEHQYYGRRYSVGDEYQCEEPVAQKFKAMGWVRLSEIAGPIDVSGETPSRGTYNTRDMVASRPRTRKAST